MLDFTPTPPSDHKESARRIAFSLVCLALFAIGVGLIVYLLRPEIRLVLHPSGLI